MCVNCNVHSSKTWVLNAEDMRKLERNETGMKDAGCAMLEYMYDKTLMY